MKNLMKRKFNARPIWLFATFVLAVVFSTTNAQAETKHCDGFRTDMKAESEDSPTTLSTVDQDNNPVDVTVTIAGPNIFIAAVDDATTLAGADWCIKSGTKTNDGTGLVGASTNINKKGKVRDVGYVVLYSVTIDTPPLCTVLGTTNPAPCTVGAGGPGGGIVFYLDESGGGLEAALRDQTNAIWGAGEGCNDILIDTDTSIDSGAENTRLIIDACDVGSAAHTAAAVGQGWFLPSKDELNEMYINIGLGGDQKNEGGFAFNFYWSSSDDNDYAWAQDFDGGYQRPVSESAPLRVRAVRAFNY